MVCRCKHPANLTVQWSQGSFFPKRTCVEANVTVMPVMPWIRWPLCLPCFLCFVESVWATWCQLPKHNSCKGQTHSFAARRVGCPWIDADVELAWQRQTGDHLDFVDWDKDGYLNVLELYRVTVYTGSSWRYSWKLGPQKTWVLDKPRPN